ncbi:MAG: acriflavin resistance protein [Gammaproteobacteria bacterium]|jgi:multidrug efflux pump subunit AcrB|nr:acriflavin resistance protein [Gammaproteobacteria bacterium]
MTLGGLALAVGILVDDATVTIENINRHLEEGQDVEPAILQGSFEIAIPALVSTLSICIVFVPMFLLSGVARYLFVPLAGAVVFAMLTSYVPADKVSQILNFGAPAPIDIQISGSSPQNHEIANALVASLRHVPGLVDLRLGEVMNQPELRVTTDRSRAQQLGISQHDVANNLLLTLSGSGQIAPTFWLNLVTGLQYPLVAQAPQYRMTSLQDLQNLPVTTAGQQQILGGLASITRGFGPAIVVHRDARPIIDIYGAAQDRDLGAIDKDINVAIGKWDGKLPKGTHITVRGQVQTMTASYTGLAIGFIGAIALVYLLIVINFQSWTDAFIIITALPAAVAGIAWMLLITDTTLSVPVLTGAIMCMGVGTANSILVVSFARDRLNQGATPLQAAYDAGFTRFRPVLMTALAMIIGMLPMSLGLGEGGEQNAPLGRAVIGGLLLATVATLVFVPTIFAAIHGRRGDKFRKDLTPSVAT